MKKMAPKASLALVILTIFSFTECQKSCTVTFVETEALVTFLKGQQRMIFNRCVGKELKNALRIEVKNKDVPTIEAEAFNNIPTLEEVIIDNSNTYHFNKWVFWKLPRLKTVKITRNKITNIKELIFVNLTMEHIDLSDNEITNIFSNAFEGCRHLRVMKFNRNHISHFFSEWFASSADTVEEIDVGENLITYIPKETFINLRRLHTVRLNNNLIKTLHPDVFKGQSNMNLIDLSFNRLKELYRYVTDPFSSSRVEMRLNNNRLNYLVEGTLQHLQYAKVYLHSNPWKCACYAKIRDWTVKYQIDVVFKSDCLNDELLPVCIEQERYPKKCTQEVDKNITETYYTFYRKVSCTTNLT